MKTYGHLKAIVDDIQKRFLGFAQHSLRKEKLGIYIHLEQYSDYNKQPGKRVSLPGLFIAKKDSDDLRTLGTANNLNGK